MPSEAARISRYSISSKSYLHCIVLKSNRKSLNEGMSVRVHSIRVHLAMVVWNLIAPEITYVRMLYSHGSVCRHSKRNLFTGAKQKAWECYIVPTTSCGLLVRILEPLDNNFKAPTPIFLRGFSPAGLSPHDFSSDNL